MDLEKLVKKMTAATEKTAEGLQAIDKRLGDQDGRLDRLEEKARTRKAPRVPGLEDEADQFSFQRAILAIQSGDWSEAGFEKEAFDATRKTALAQGTDSLGGFLVPPEVLDVLIDLLRAMTVLDKVGVTMMPGLSGSPVEVPKQTGGATAFWVGENTAVTESNQTFGQVKLTPHTVAGLTKVSNRLLRLSSPAAEGIIRRDLMQVMARKADIAGLRGPGAAGEPLGVSQTTGIGTVALGVNGAAITLDDMYKLVLEVEKDNVDIQRGAWVMHPQLWDVIRRLKDGDNRFFLEPDGELRPGQGTILGYPFFTTTQIPTDLTKGTGTALTELYFADWQELLWGQWGTMELAVTTQAGDAFEKNQTWVRILWEIDFAVRHAEAFALINDAQSS